eukprot:m.126568 g.126568  ORF g.126568 m.126568 type:complete len:1164 (+) comp11193_c0_seq1:124-3615(+)
MPASAAPPDVTGLRPAYGPEVGGDNIKVLGSDLGTSRDDIIDVKFVGNSCGAKNIHWVSPNKLECTLPSGRGKGSVVVTTRSGGEGTSSVQFTYEAASDGEEEDAGIDPLEEHDEWSEQFDFAPDSKMSFLTRSTDTDPLELNARGKKRFQPTGVPVAEVVKAYGQYGFSSSLADEAFKPACCLTDTYINATERDLRDGLANLEKRSQKKGNPQKVLLKNHVSTFIACFDAVSKVNRLIGDKGGGTGITADLEHVIDRITQTATELYQPMLDKRRECERDRTALAVLNNYKYLFSLPKDLMLKMREEDWTAVIAGYERAKSAKTQTSITVFAEILDVVESIIETVRAKLFSMLADAGRSHDELGRIIGYLHELGSDQDPGWFCLVRQKDHVMARLDQCVDVLYTCVESADEMLVSMQMARWDVIKARVRSARMKSVVSQSSVASMPLSRHESDNADVSMSDMSILRNSGGSASQFPPENNGIAAGGSTVAGNRRIQGRNRHPAVIFIEGLSRVVNEHLPSAWKLGLASLKRMAGVEDDASLEDLDAYSEAADDEHGGHAIREQKLELEKIIMDVLDSYASKVRDHVMDKGSDVNTSNPDKIPISTWLPQCEAQIRKCLGLLSALGLSETCISGLAELSADFQKHTVHEVFEEAVAETKRLQSAEDWEPSTDGLHTGLPDRFGALVSRGLGSLSELCSAPTNPSGFIFEEDEEAEQFMCDVLSAFTTVLERLAYEASAQPTVSESPTRNLRGRVAGRKKEAPAEKRWMLVMSNCLYTRKTVVPMIARKFEGLLLGSLDMPFDDELRVLEDLDFRCFESLLNQRATLLQTLLLRCVSEMPKNGGKPPLHVRPYAKQILLQLIQVHADVAAYARPFVKRVISQLLIRVAKNMHVVISNYDLLGQDPAAGIDQLMLEVIVMKRVLTKFDRDPSVWTDAEELLKQLSQSRPKKPPAKKIKKNKTPRARAPNPLPNSTSAAPPPKRAPAPAKPQPKGGGTGTVRPAPPRRGGSRALPKPGGSSGGRTLPKPGASRKALPKPPGRRSLPSPGAAAAAPSPGRAASTTPSPLPPLPTSPDEDELPPKPPADDSESDAPEEDGEEEEEEEEEEVDIEASVSEFLRRTRFQHACFQVDLSDEFDMDDVAYDDAEIQTALEVAPTGGDDDDDFV